VGAEGAGEVIDAAISYNRESIKRGMLEETKESCRVGHEQCEDDHRRAPSASRVMYE
jgi:hypothetical protein